MKTDRVFGRERTTTLEATNDKEEQRKHKRIQVYQSTFFRSSDPQTLHDCLVHDISQGGILFETKETLAPLEHVLVAIRYGNKVHSEDIEIVRSMRLISLRYGGRFCTEANAKIRAEWLAELEFGSD